MSLLNIDKYELDALKEYMTSHKYGTQADYDLRSLFKMFSAVAIFDIKDLFLAPKRYMRFVQQNINLIHPDSTGTTKEIVLKLLENECKILENKIKSNCTVSQQQFAEIVQELSSSADSILDVGSGDIPYSSILLGENNDNISSMDMNFAISPEALSRLNVDSIIGAFTTDANIKNHDLVVGQRPCSAIAHMVEECVKQNKPYFIELCNCHIPPSKIPGKPATWHDIMPEIDAYVRFYGPYAYHLDATEEQVKKIVEEHQFFQIRDKYIAEKMALYNINFDMVDSKNIKSFFIDKTVTPLPKDIGSQPGE